jgi:ABC-type multidrug transport system fused ATPase/permease subunit
MCVLMCPCVSHNFHTNRGATKASRVLHDGALNAVAFAPMRFFDTQPVGRILNRFR